MTNHSPDHVHGTRCWWNPDQARWVCRPARPPSEATTTDRPLVDVRDMLVVHTALLREFRLAPAAVARTSPDDRRQVGRVAAHLTLLLDLLHHHHAGEDELLWPLLVERVPPSVRAVVDQAEAQHADIDAALTDVRSELGPWVAGPDPAGGERLAGHLDKLHTVLREHLDLEERALLPHAAALLTEQEWHAIGAAAVEALPRPLLPLVFGMFAYEGDPVVLRSMLAQAPAVPRLLLPRIAPRVYARRARRVHGTRRP
ncbi:hemerythrin domain-containing protein [Jatrophihabitans sp. YIM 134969]